MTIPERRQFERLTIAEDAIAYREDGGKLGRVTAVSGGGMTIRLADESVIFTPGSRFVVRVVEPVGDIEHMVPVIVVYMQAGSLGLEFV
jgi:hypothetical protein